MVKSRLKIYLFSQALVLLIGFYSKGEGLECSRLNVLVNWVVWMLSPSEIIRNLAGFFIPPTPETLRLLKVQLKRSVQLLNIFSPYMPTNF